MNFNQTFTGVKTRHPEYMKRYPQWELMRDIIEGEDAIKAKGEDYLPYPSTAHYKYDEYERKTYEAFKARTPFANFTSQIKDCLHGMLEYRKANVNVPLKIRSKGILDNINLQGDSLDQFFSDIVSDVLITGSGGILVDLPKVNKDISVLAAEKLGIRPYFTYYSAEKIINWDFPYINGIKKLALVVLEEEVNDKEDEFSHKTRKQYRVLRLNKQGICEQEIQRVEKDKDGKEFTVVESKIVVTINNKTINYIPFVMLPFSNPVKPILYDIGLLNIHHFQVYADYMNGAHLTSRPTGWFTGHTPETDERGEPIPVIVGSDVFWQLPEPEAKVGVCSFSGEGIEHLERTLDRLEAQIITLASHCISAEKKTAENKDTVALHRQGEDAKLATYGKYLSYRFTEALKIICSWYDCTDEELDEVLVELNTDFSQLSFDANAVNSIANIFSQGKLPLRCLYYLLKSSGYLEADMSYNDFVYLLDLESTTLSPTEVETAYRQYKRNGQKIKVEVGDYYSPQTLYNDNEKSKDIKNEKEDIEE